MTPSKETKKKKPGMGDKKKKAPVEALHESTTPALDFPPAAYRVMWDWERDGFKKVTRPRLPSVFRCGELSDSANGHYVDLTHAWQFFWFDLCCKIVYGRYHQELTPKEYEWLADRWTVVGATKTAFTNQHGLNDFRNYILKKRLNREEPKIYTLVCGGATLTGTPVLFTGKKRRAWMLKVDCFDGNQPPPPVETIDPYTDSRVFFATTIVKRKIMGKYQVVLFDESTHPPGYKFKEFKEGYKMNPFPQFKIGDRLFDCPIPLIASKDIYYPLKDLVALDTSQKPSPYFS